MTRAPAFFFRIFSALVVGLVCTSPFLRCSVSGGDAGDDSFCWALPDPACNPFPTAILYTARFTPPRLKHLIVGRTVPDMFQMDPDASNQILLTSSLSAQFFHDVDSRDGRIYITTAGANVVLRMDGDGSNIVTLITAGGNTAGIDVDEIGNHIYYIDSTNVQLHRTDLDGTNSTLIATFGGALSGVQVDHRGGYIYVAETSGPIYRVDLDGNNMTQILNVSATGGGPSGLKLDHSVMGQLYWANNVAGLISKANVDGTNITDLVSITGPNRLAVDIYSQSLYFTAGTGLYRMAPGESPRFLVSATFYADIIPVYE